MIPLHGKICFTVLKGVRYFTLTQLKIC